MEGILTRSFTAQSVLAEMPMYRTALFEEDKGEKLAAAFKSDPGLPGVIIRRGQDTGMPIDAGEECLCISRGQYLKTVARYLGPELYHPRPIRVMLDAVEALELPLRLPDSCSVQEAVRQCIIRPSDKIYEPFLVELEAGGETTIEGNLALADFQDLIMADSQVSTLRNQQMEQILRTVDEGLMLIGPDYRIASEYSRAAAEILEAKELTGIYLPELISSFTDEATGQRSEDYLRTLYNPNVIEKLITKINPLDELKATFTPAGERSKEKILRFSFLRGMEGGQIRRVLVQVNDVTRQVKLAQELEEQEQRAKERTELVFHLVRTDPRDLGEFLDALSRELEQAASQIQMEGTVSSLEDVRDSLYRIFHGLKGEAGLLNLPLHQRRLHEFEDELQLLKEKQRLSLEDIFSLQPSLDRMQQLTDESFAVIDQFRKLSQVNVSGDNRSYMFEAIGRMVHELAQKHGKKAVFSSQSSEQDIPQEYRRLMREAIIQLARNSIVHGIEDPQERARIGKPEEGMIQFAVRIHEHEGQIEMVFQDDGRGLDMNRIAEKATRLGLGWSTQEELLNLLFHSGFSTAQETTMEAGRGVGLNLIRERVTEYGGIIVPHSEPGIFCAFQIVLPLQPTESIDREIGTASSDVEAGPFRSPTASLQPAAIATE